MPHNKFVKTKTVFQMEVCECGAASLSMVMGAYGVHVPLEVLRVDTGASRNGVNAKNICIAAEKYGFEANGYRRDAKRLFEVTEMPCIIYWDARHFVVLEGIRFNKVRINDPARGRIAMSMDEFEKHYTGVVLEILSTDMVIKKKDERTLLRFSLNRLKGKEKYVVTAFLLGVCLILPGVLTPVFSRVFLDRVIGDSQRSVLKWLLFAMILTALYNGYFTFIRGQFKERFTNYMILDSSDDMLHHMLRLPLSFFEQRMAGDLTQRAQNNADVNNFLAGDLITTFVSLVTSLVYLAIMMAYSFKLALVGLAFSVFSLAAVSLTMRTTAEYSQRYGVDYAALVGDAYSGLMVSASIKAAGSEDEYSSRTMGRSALVHCSDQKLGRIQQTLDVIPQSINAINNIVILILGSKLVLDGSFTPGILIAFNGYLGLFSEPFSSLISFTRSMQQVKNDMGRVDDLMHYEEDDCYDTFNKREDLPQKFTGAVELKDISFAYGVLDKPLIKNLNLKLEPGKSVAFVGPSGCGKSTIIKLIASLYRPWTGEILLDGISLNQIPQKVLGKNLAYVTQNIVLFEGTIEQNIRAWDDSITQERVVMAARDACIHDDIIKKKGAYDHWITSNGSNLSGGQRQRIEIAKALACDPSVLILDEATSSLDTTTERQIYENIKNRNCTCIIVAQRLSSIKTCDEIIFLKNGRVIERGTHEELMEKKGSYYELVSKSDN